MVALSFLYSFAGLLSLQFLGVGAAPASGPTVNGLTDGDILNLLNLGLVQSITTTITVRRAAC